jgi:lysozyme family protein
MLSIDSLVDDILKAEGGYVNHPSDHGGPTNMGITLATLSAWRGVKVTTGEVVRLRESEARSIYESEYFLKPKIDRLPVAMQPVLFDMAVNMGASRAIKVLQNSLVASGFNIVIDGNIGTATIDAATRACDTPDFLSKITHERIAFYKRICEKDPTQKVFLAGWINRANKFKK